MDILPAMNTHILNQKLDLFFVKSSTVIILPQQVVLFFKVHFSVLLISFFVFFYPSLFSVRLVLVYKN